MEVVYAHVSPAKFVVGGHQVAPLSTAGEVRRLKGKRGHRLQKRKLTFSKRRLTGKWSRCLLPDSMSEQSQMPFVGVGTLSRQALVQVCKKEMIVEDTHITTCCNSGFDYLTPPKGSTDAHLRTKKKNESSRTSFHIMGYHVPLKDTGPFGCGCCGCGHFRLNPEPYTLNPKCERKAYSRNICSRNRHSRNVLDRYVHRALLCRRVSIEFNGSSNTFS